MMTKTFLLYLIVCSILASTKDLRDKVVVRLNTEIFFLSDINKVISKFKQFNCTLGSSMLEEQFQIKGMRPINFSQNLAEQSVKNKVDRIAGLLKVGKFIERDGPLISTKVRNLFIESAASNNCGKIVLSELKSGMLGKILRSELYFKRRFAIKNFSISTVEFKKDRNLFKNLADGKALLALRKRKQQVAIDDFLRSLSGQVKQREYF